MNRIRTSIACVVVAGLAVAYIAQAQAPQAERPLQNGAAKHEPAAEHSVLQAAAKSTEKGKQEAVELCKCAGESEPEQRIRKVLSGPLHSGGINVAEQALNDVMNQLQEAYEIPIVLDTAALDAVGIRANEMMTAELKNTSLRSALRLLLKNLQLTFVIQDEVLLITTPDEAEKKLVTCVYDVRTITNGDERSLRSLAELISNSVTSNSWSDNGGTGGIYVLKPNLLVVTQTQSVHHDVMSLLATLREMRSDTAMKQVNGGGHSPEVEILTCNYKLKLKMPEGDTGAALREQIHSLIIESLPAEVWQRSPNGPAVALEVFPDRIVVRQTPEVQDKIKEILAGSEIASISDSDQKGGGMGGGYFRISAPAAREDR